MDSLEANKIVGAVLGTVFVLFGGSLLADAIFHSEVPEKPGYTIVAAEAPAAGAAAGPAAAAVPIATLLASASPEKGAVQFKKCQACHDGSDGGANKVGPHLYDVVNRPMASVSDFAYSAGIKTFSEGSSVKWDYDHLNHFLAGPKAYINGTAMGFAGLKSDQDRADLISYLRTLSHSPAPLPEAPAPGSAAEATPAAPAEQQAAAAAPAAAGTAAAAPAAAAPVQTASAGDAKAGANVFKKCQACHAVGEGAANKVGPELNGIDGEKIAEVTGYTFSAALTTFAGSNPVWTDELLGKWLADPKALVPGTKMAFPGLKKPDEIANVIAYLKSFDETGKPKGN